MKNDIACVDLFCGAGGLTHGFILEGVPVVAGIDLDPACRFPYETNNGQAKFTIDVASPTVAYRCAIVQCGGTKIHSPCGRFSDPPSRGN